MMNLLKLFCFKSKNLKIYILLSPPWPSPDRSSHYWQCGGDCESKVLCTVMQSHCGGDLWTCIVNFFVLFAEIAPSFDMTATKDEESQDFCWNASLVSVVFKHLIKSSLTCLLHVYLCFIVSPSLKPHSPTGAADFFVFPFLPVAVWLPAPNKQQKDIHTSSAFHGDSLQFHLSPQNHKNLHDQAMGYVILYFPFFFFNFLLWQTTFILRYCELYQLDKLINLMHI